MEKLTFGYFLLRRPDDPMGNPVNLIAEADGLGPTQAVIWDRSAGAWTFRPDVAAAILWANPERHQIERVDRATAERQAAHFAATPLPTEEELTGICRRAA